MLRIIMLVCYRRGTSADCKEALCKNKMLLFLLIWYSCCAANKTLGGCGGGTHTI